MARLETELFIACWQAGTSITHVSVMLAKAGHPEMTPKRVRVTAAVLRQFGVNLKRIPVSDLPDLAPPQVRPRPFHVFVWSHTPTRPDFEAFKALREHRNGMLALRADRVAAADLWFSAVAAAGLVTSVVVKLFWW